MSGGFGTWWPNAALELAARLCRAGDHAAAAQRCREVVAANAFQFDALCLLGRVCLDQAAFGEAITFLDRAARVRPADAAVLFDLGNALAGLGRHGEAIAAFQRAVALAPGHVDALNNLGNALAAAGQQEEAIESLRRALAVRPGYPPALFNLGKRLADCGRFEAALESFGDALASAGPKADPARLTDIQEERSRVLIELGRPEKALAATRAMLGLNADPGRAKWCMSHPLLALGRFAEGWENYEFRYAVDGRSPPHGQAGVLDLAQVSGKRVLVCAEQGFGDTIMFVRYAPLLARAGATVSLSVPPELTALLGGMDGVATVTAADADEPSADLVTALPSLPLAFGTEVDSIPAAVPYLRPPAERVAAWRERLGPRDRPRIGICWRGAQHIPRRSLPLERLAPLFERTDLAFHIVQKDLPAPDRDWVAAHPAIRDHHAALADFADTAALLASLDLVITIDTAVAHLAGALARPVWIMLHLGADWRWLTGREDSPWYPTARLFRQREPGGWDGVVTAVMRALGDHFFGDLLP